MNALAALLRGLLRFAVVGVLVALGIIGFFVAWWLVLFAALALSVYFGMRRFLGASPRPPAGSPGTVIIEGEYEVERDAGNEAARARERVIEVGPAPPPGEDRDKK